MDQLTAAISAGELFDKISILLIKAERFHEAEKLKHVQAELELLLTVAARFAEAGASLSELLEELKAVNEAIWVAEDVVREFERLGRFDEAFIAIARSTYRNNDRRAAIKRRINILLKSQIVEEKSHAEPPRDSEQGDKW